MGVGTVGIVGEDIRASPNQKSLLEPLLTAGSTPLFAPFLLAEDNLELRWSLWET